MSFSSMLELIPASAIYRRRPLDPRLNALKAWREAAAEFVIPDQDRQAWETLAFVTQVPSPHLAPGQLSFVRKVLGHNAECLAALDRGMERGQLQFAELPSLERVAEEIDFVTRLDEAARLRLLRFRLWYSEGDIVAAAEELFRLEKIGTMVCQGEGQMLHYLIGLRLRETALRGFGHLAAGQQTPLRVLDRIQETLEEGLRASDGLIQSLRAELCWITLVQLDRTLEDADLEKIVDLLLQIYYVPFRVSAARGPGSEQSAIADGLLKERRQQLLFLLHDHPHPLDKHGTARLMGAIVAETIRDLNHYRRPSNLNVVRQLHSMRRKMRAYRLARKTRFWPIELMPKRQIESTSNVDAMPPPANVIVVCTSPENLTLDRLTALRAKLRRIDNPIGMMLAERLMAIDYSAYLLEHLRKLKTMCGLIKRQLTAATEIKG
jgi:hypothetical protein